MTEMDQVVKDEDDADDESLPYSKQLLVLSQEAGWFEKTTPADVDASYRDGEGRIIVHYDAEAFREIHDTRYGNEEGV